MMKKIEAEKVAEILKAELVRVHGYAKNGHASRKAYWEAKADGIQFAIDCLQVAGAIRWPNE